MDSISIKSTDRFLKTGDLGVSNSIGASNQIPASRGSSEASGSDQTFAATLKDAINTVNQQQVASDKAIQNLATGKTENVADVMIAAEKADISLRLMMQVRNKLIDAYQEIMKMQV